MSPESIGTAVARIWIENRSSVSPALWTAPFVSGPKGRTGRAACVRERGSVCDFPRPTRTGGASCRQLQAATIPRDRQGGRRSVRTGGLLSATSGLAQPRIDFAAMAECCRVPPRASAKCSATCDRSRTSATQGCRDWGGPISAQMPGSCQTLANLLECRREIEAEGGRRLWSPTRQGF